MPSARRRRIGLIVLAVIALAIVAGVAWLMARPGVSVTSGVNDQVTIVCSGAAGTTAEACLEWGDAILIDDPAPRTFERKDLRRVSIDRSAWGFGDECNVAFFISRYADRPVWSGDVECR